MHGAMAIFVRVKQVASEASSTSSVSGRSGRKFFFPDVVAETGLEFLVRTSTARWRLAPSGPPEVLTAVLSCGHGSALLD